MAVRQPNIRLCGGDAIQTVSGLVQSRCLYQGLGAHHRLEAGRDASAVTGCGWRRSASRARQTFSLLWETWNAWRLPLSAPSRPSLARCTPHNDA